VSDALLVGGTSEIGLAIVRGLVPRRVWLLGRDDERLARAAAEFNGAAVEVGLLDADDVGSHRQTIERAFADADGFDVVVIALGVLGAQAGLDADPDEAIEVMRVNFLGAGSLLLECLRQLRRRGAGTLVLLSSAAVERPRASNPIYGAAKAGLDALAQGLSDAIASSEVRVLVVRPGFVKTCMTAGLEPAPFATTPEVVASATVAALRGRAGTIWVPGRLRLMFAVLRHLPRSVYRRLPL
jgi:decaprenylphospho-beta-D-erythro-pentofuranosid-2-ulose 2-reductase